MHQFIQSMYGIIDPILNRHPANIGQEITIPSSQGRLRCHWPHLCQNWPISHYDYLALRTSSTLYRDLLKRFVGGNHKVCRTIGASFQEEHKPVHKLHASL